MRHTRVNLLDFSFGLFPVVAVFDLAAHAPLIARQAFLMLLQTIERRNKTPIAERGKAGNADIDADRGYGDVFGRAQNFPAVAVADPAQFREFDGTVRLIDGELIPVWESKVIGGSAFFLKHRGVARFSKSQRGFCSRTLNRP